MASRCGCGSAQCSCAVISGDGILVSGVGSAGNPYIISATGAALGVTDTPSLDLTLTGAGVPGNPWALSGKITPSTTAGNLLTLDGAGVLVSSTAVRNAVGATVGNGVAYVIGTGSLVAKLSTDSGNVLTFGTDGGLLSPASTTVVAAPLHLSNSSGNTLLDGQVGGDTNPRITLVADGPLRWSDGAHVWDTNLYRAGTSILRTDGSLIAAGGFTAETSYITSAVTGTYGTTDRRWSIGPDSTAEGGANVGSLFQITRYTDAGVAIDTPFQIERATGRVYIGGLAGTSGSGLTVQRNATGPAIVLLNTTASGQGLMATMQGTASTVLSAQVTGDTTARYRFGVAGDMEWGGGAAVRDLFAARTAAGVLTLTGALVVTAGLAVTAGVGSRKTYVKPLPDTSRASTVALVADPYFTGMALEANATYTIEGYLQYAGAPTGTGDLKMDFTGPSGFAMTFSSGAVVASAPATSYEASATTIPASRVIGTNGSVDMVAHLSGYLTTSATSGSLALRWGQGTSIATATLLRAGSWLRLERVL
ncbi:hypothetical protein ACEZCY_14230 [Streptacidiphilus sp. N1-12]|uniref:Uncharacterized protein n=2 Tax=Streptacidiphilus alkalitolerans TaxID=3342712 RepID=A0ABV6V9K9_9ACTN